MYFKFTNPAQHAEVKIPGNASNFYAVDQINSDHVTLQLSTSHTYTIPIQGTDYVILSSGEMEKYKKNRVLDIEQTFDESSYHELLGLEELLSQAITKKQAIARTALLELEKKAKEVSKDNGFHLTFIVE